MHVAMAGRPTSDPEAMEQGARLKALRQRAGLSRPKLGKMVDLSDDAIAHYENGRNKLSRNTDLVNKLVVVLGTTAKHLIQGEDVRESTPGKRLIPILGPLSAGPPVAGHGDAGEMEVDEWRTRKERWGRPVVGNSMELLIFDGDRVVVEEGEPQDGWIASAFNSANESLIKIYRKREGTKYLESANPEAEAIAEEPYIVEGYVVEVHRDMGGQMEMVIRRKDHGPLNADRWKRSILH